MWHEYCKDQLLISVGSGTFLLNLLKGSTWQLLKHVHKKKYE